jgi:hypothetical protein
MCLFVSTSSSSFFFLNTEPTTKERKFPRAKEVKKHDEQTDDAEFDKQNFLDVYARKWQRKLFIQT